MPQEPFRDKDFGHYTIKSLLGSGGMGAVYRAWDSELRRDVAIKVLPDPFSQDAERISRFRREAEILASSATRVPTFAMHCPSVLRPAQHRAGLHLDRVYDCWRWLDPLRSLRRPLFGWHRGVRTPSLPLQQVWHFEVAAPQDAEISSNEGIGLALSKDGRLLAYQTADGPVIRSADRTLPFFSPDGEWVVFGTRTMLNKIPTSGGPVRAICDCLVNPAFGGDWHTNTIVFATSEGLFQVSADGGTPELLAKANLERGELYLTWPQILPTGDCVLYTIRPQETNQGSQVAMLNLKTRKSRTLFRGGANARYVAPGYLVYAAGQKLEARTFDLDTLETGKDPITLYGCTKAGKDGPAGSEAPV